MHRKRIARGARWLDKQNPDWFEKINTETLNPSSSTRCVIGQVFGNFDEKINRRYYPFFSFDPPAWVPEPLLFAYPPTWVVMRFIASHGFATLRETDSEWKQAWVAEIDKRVEASRPLYIPESWEQAVDRRTRERSNA